MICNSVVPCPCRQSGAVLTAQDIPNQFSASRFNVVADWFSLYMYIKRCPPPFSTAYNSRVNKSLCFWLYHFHHQCQWLISMSFSKSSILSSFHFQASLVMSAQINIRIEGCSFSQSHTCPDVQIYCRHKRWNLRQPWRINHTHSPLP